MEIEPISAVSSIDTTPALAPVYAASATCPAEPAASAPSPPPVDHRSAALNIAQHAAAFIPGPLPFAYRNRPQDRR